MKTYIKKRKKSVYLEKGIVYYYTMEKTDPSILEKSVLDILDQYKTTRKTFTNDVSNNHFVNTHIDHVYVINLVDNEIRRNYMTRVMEKYEINFELIIVPRVEDDPYNVLQTNNMKREEFGCYLSHMYCLQDAIQKKYKHILIFEDDVVFHKKFHVLFEKITTQQKYNILLLGALDFDYKHINRHLVHDHVYTPDKQSTFLGGAHAICYSHVGARIMFRVRLKKPTFFDNHFVFLTTFFPTTFLICSPNLVIQEMSTSNLNHFWITRKKEEKEYYHLCVDDSFSFKQYNWLYLELLVCIKQNNTPLYSFLSLEENMILVSSFFLNNDYLEKKILNNIDYSFFTLEDIQYIVK